MERLRLTFLDGPMGTELERQGIALSLPLWTAQAVRDEPDAVRAIHAAYASAGADVHTAATFRTTARALACELADPEWKLLTHAAVALCREGAGRDAQVAGSMAPLEDCYHPERTPDDDTLRAEHDAMAACLADADVDLVLVETMPTQRELGAATRAAAATRLPVWTAVTLGPEGAFFDADSLLRAAATAAEEGADAFLLNCTSPQLITPLLATLAQHSERPAVLGAYANTIFEDDTGESPLHYVRDVAHWIEAGADIVGGCCGTTPKHLAALCEAFGDP